MYKTLVLAAASAAFFAPGAGAQVRDTAVAAVETEAVVKVINVDRKARTVTFRGPNGGTVLMNVPQEAQNLDQVKPGAQFKVRYVEAMAVAVNKGGDASASELKTVKLAPKGGTPGGTVTETRQITGKIEALDYTSRAMAVRGPGGNVLAFKVSDDVKNLDQVSVGDTIALTYTRALAMAMLPEEGKAPAAMKK